MSYLFRTLIIIIVLVAAWWIIVALTGVPAYILPTPWAVAKVFYHQSGLIVSEARYTVTVTLVGFALSIIFACLTALVMAYYRYCHYWLFPVLLASQALPTFALAPLLVVWLGYGMTSKIVLTVIMLFFPITSAFYDGLINTPQAALDLSHSMRAHPFRTLLFIRIPYALPSLGTGLRVGSTYAPLGAIVGEWIGSNHGLGYLLLNANAHLQINMMFAVLIVVIALTLGFYFTIDLLLKCWLYWSRY